MEIQLSGLMLLHSCYVIWCSHKDNNYLLQEIELVIECMEYVASLSQYISVYCLQ